MCLNILQWIKTLILQVIAHHKVADAATADAKQDSVQHLTTANGEKYALPTKPSTKQQGVSICMHVCTYIWYKSATA